MELSPWTLRFSEPFSFAKAFCTVFILWITKTRRCPVLIGCLRQWCSAIQPEGTPGVTRSVVDKLRSSTPASLGLPTWRGYQADFNGRCVVFKMYTGVYHRFIVSMGTRRAAWRRSQGCDCVARELKWKINLCPWILRWICSRGYILAWDFWLRATGCPDRSVSPCLLYMKRKPGFKKIGPQCVRVATAFLFYIRTKRTSNARS